MRSPLRRRALFLFKWGHREVHSRHVVQAVQGSAAAVSVAFFCRRKPASFRRNHLLRCARSAWQNL